MGKAFIIAAVRTPVGRAPRGVFRATRPDELAAIALQAAVERAGVPAGAVEDVILGCAMPEAEQGLNVARIAALRAGFPVTAAAATVNRFCASGIEAVAIAAQRIETGMGAGASVIVAGGAESMSLVPSSGHTPRINPWLMEHHPDTYLSMGLTAERVAQKYEISREDADAFALESHRKAIAAQDAGAFDDELVAVETRVPDTATAGLPLVARGWPSTAGSKRPLCSWRSQTAPYGWTAVRVTQDEGPRRDTTLEALRGLKAAFHAHGTVTAGNSSQRSDGAAAALLASEEYVREHGLKPVARLAAYATAGVEPGLMGMGPVAAIPRALGRAGIGLNDIDSIELNEAFAAQALAVIREAGLDPERVNRRGGAIALGHPLGCTGAKLLATLLRILKQRHARWGLITMCVGGGQGAAAVIENLRS